MLLFLSSSGSKQLCVSDNVVMYERTSCNQRPVSERTCAGLFGVHPQSVHNILHMVLMLRDIFCVFMPFLFPSLTV